VQGVDALDPYFARYLPALAMALVVPLAILAWVATIDLLSAAVMLVTIPLIPIFGILIGRTTSSAAHARYAALGRLAGHFLDVVRGLTTLRAFNRGAAQADGIAETGEEYRRETMRVLRVAFLSSLVLELAASLSVAVIAVEIGVRLVGGSIAFAPAFAVLILAPELYQPLRNVAAQFHASADGLAAAERILDAVDGEPAPRGAKPALDPRDAPIRFDGVDFAYPSRPDAPVLRDAAFAIAPGERVAIVGPSGIGKSTIARLLLRFDEPDAGRVAIGEQDLADVDPDDWRERIAWVPQRPALTSGTIADAIALGRPGADRSAIADAARAAGAEAFIAELPAGLDTRVGDGGVELSTGQTRRIALARALLRDAPLLLLDEPTTSLDADSAAIVAAALERLPRNRSMLLITHDPELAARIADRVLVVEDGAVRPLAGSTA
jgi:thiol reductant ABC exporter CydD subunit